MIGIICATDDELAAIRALGAGSSEGRLIAGERFHALTYDDAEHRAVVTRTEIGKVNAAIAATLLVSHPDLAVSVIVVVGVGGGVDPGLVPGDTVIAARVGCYDYGVVDADGVHPVTPGVFPLGAPRAKADDVHPIALEVSRALVAMQGAADTPGRRLRLGAVVSGDLFINSEPVRQGLRRDFAADVVDMESHAVFQVGQRFGVPVIVLRSISDLAGDDAGAQYVADLAHSCDRAASFLPDLLRILSRAHPELVG